MWSTLSAKPKTDTIGSLFLLSKDCTVSLTSSRGAEGAPKRSKFTYNNRAKQKVNLVNAENPTPKHCCYNDSSYWHQFWDYSELKNCRLSVTS